MHEKKASAFPSTIQLIKNNTVNKILFFCLIFAFRHNIYRLHVDDGTIPILL